MKPMLHVPGIRSLKFSEYRQTAYVCPDGRELRLAPSGRSSFVPFALHGNLRRLLLALLLCGITVAGNAQNAAKIIKTYLSGYEKKDWNITSSQLADGFTFTSPAPDDHIPLAVYKQKCWPQSKFIKKFDFISIAQEGDHAFALYNLTTTDGKVIRNAEYYTFSGGKIKSIECFFGGSGAGYPTNAR